jgi:hypothetical protein
MMSFFLKIRGQPCVLFNIPDGSKKESPTSYMSITNQVYYTSVVAASLATSSSEVGGPKKNINNTQATKTTTTTTNSSVEALLENIKKVGDSIRELKTKKAPKVSTTR